MSLTKGTYANVESQIYLLLESQGYNTAAICGVLANIEKESGFRYDIEVNDKGKLAYGLCQWRGDRRTKLKNKYGNTPGVSQQIEYLLSELKESSYQETNAALSNAVNSESGAYNVAHTFVRNFERPQRYQNGKDVYVERGNRAREYFRYYKDGYVGSVSAGDINLNTSSSPEIETNIPEYLSLSSIDPYSEIITGNLSKVTAEGFDYGYLIDMTHNREFKFYIPEFSESAGAKWGDINIPGRSVSIKSYQSTDSRSVTINLDLYAGVGLYKGEGDIVGKVHSDANFVKSLEYPDYNASIIRPPATVHLILGSAFNIQGVVHDVNVEHKKPLDAQNRAMYLKLSFTVTQTSVNPPQYSDIANGISAIVSTENVTTISNRGGMEKPGINNTYVSLN